MPHAIEPPANARTACLPALPLTTALPKRALNALGAQPSSVVPSQSSSLLSHSSLAAGLSSPTQVSSVASVLQVALPSPLLIEHLVDSSLAIARALHAHEALWLTHCLVLRR